MIELNFSHMMEEVIGSRGLSERIIEDLRDRAKEVHKQIGDRLLPELAFIDLISQDTSEIKRIAREIRRGAESFLILGIGGSALGPRAILEALSPFHNLQKIPKIFIYDNVDPRTLKQILALTDLKTTSVNVISKSGSTAETAAAFMILWDEMKKVPCSDISKRFIATTDPEKGNLRKIVNEEGLKSLAIPQGVGGRYSVLSPVGLLLSEVIGIDADELLMGARDIQKKCSDQELWKNPAYLFGTLLYLMDREKHRTIDVMMAYADGLKPFTEWFCQLWAESLGKQGRGLTPYPSIGSTDQHSQLQLWIDGTQDKVLIFIRVNDYSVDIQLPDIFQNMEGLSYLSGHTLSELIKAEEEATELALAKAGRPNMTITVPQIDAYHMGQLFHFLELATAFTGLLYEINPFNQPGVEEGKNLTYGMMGKKGFEEKRKEVEDHREKKARWRI
ncbi:MAG: glucose-6-phosphate isomerase [Nitrospirota bacterium]|nr:glucose-6-phosphate isomerase [Nitrospirota bacterium]MDH5767565.1 glucose-6-phosphate isomerase [Nitrospirota bacterium]